MRLHRVYFLSLFLFLLACQPVADDKPTPSSNPFLADSLFCNVDSDCTCGGLEAEDCYIGNKLYASRYVDVSKQCPDFCGGIAGNLVTRCVENQCQQVERELKACTKEAKLCPDGSVVTRQGPDCEFAPCLDVTSDIRLRTVTWQSFVPPEEGLTEEVSIVRIAEGDSFGAFEVLSGGVIRSIGPLVVCGSSVSEAQIQEFILTGEELCFRTPSMEGGVDYYLSLAECSTAADCVPDDCCHATGCTGKSNAPSCDGVMCTMDCQPGTLDCGGGCGCVEGKCVEQNFFGE